MEFTHTQIYNFKGALYGMRNPLNSWNKADSICDIGQIDTFYEDLSTVCNAYVEKNYPNVEAWNEFYEKAFESYSLWLQTEGIIEYSDDTIRYDLIGPNDLDLAQRLILAGPEHMKFMRQIFVSIDITAPLYWWKEFDTYKIGTTANSTSTMHKLAAAPIAREMFEFDNEDIVVSQGKSIDGEWELIFDDYIDDIIDMCENLRLKYIETKDKSYWRALVQILPNAWLQTRTVTMSYANLRNIYFQRRNHKLKEWHQFCDWIATLPYAKELIMLEDTNTNETN